MLLCLAGTFLAYDDPLWHQSWSVSIPLFSMILTILHHILGFIDLSLIGSVC
jgi:hypothetical protein